MQKAGAAAGHHIVSVSDNGRILTAEGRPPFTWQQRSSGVTQRLNDAQFAPYRYISNDTSQLVIVVGNAGTILRSTDLGITWSAGSSATTANLNGISFNMFDENEAWAVGDGGVIVKTTNKGQTWLPQTSGTTNDLRAVYSVGTIVIAAGAGGTFRRTDNGGDTWGAASGGSPGVTINRITFDQRMGIGGVMYAVGTGGAIYYSSNYGANWTTLTSNTTQQLNDIHFRDGLFGVALGNNGVVRNTTNGGTTWLTDAYLNTLTTADIRSAYATMEFETTLVGARQIVDTVFTSVVATSGGLATVSNTPITGIAGNAPFLPTEFALYQNYPNPFNPTTTIRYNLPSSLPVSLQVFDNLGREVRTLVHEVQESGPKSIRFDATGLAGGVYFYRLQAGEFTETRRLLLLR
ncbi:MAG: T9SS type A sorting domain-containing protein [Bacteroidetes bacterium]|nr:T9SS type A sorting domain-containing protein [Bacteroidota bacterium]MCW5894415.1 T9SS type A sorting domain-containing protein [Bacteroidota bacterium]